MMIHSLTSYISCVSFLWLKLLCWMEIFSFHYVHSDCILKELHMVKYLVSNGMKILLITN